MQMMRPRTMCNSKGAEPRDILMDLDGAGQQAV
jgi:hypothetical protein